MRSLEEQLGISLFERNSAGVLVTLAGHRFLDRARWALAELDEAARTATSVQKGTVGALGIGFYPSLTSGLLRRILAEHRVRFPVLDFTFREGVSADQLAALRQHQIDVAFLMAVDEVPELSNEHLWDERIYVAAPEDHSVATRGTLTWAGLLE